MILVVIALRARDRLPVAPYVLAALRAGHSVGDIAAVLGAAAIAREVQP